MIKTDPVFCHNDYCFFKWCFTIYSFIYYILLFDYLKLFVYFCHHMTKKWSKSCSLNQFKLLCINIGWDRLNNIYIKEIYVPLLGNIELPPSHPDLIAYKVGYGKVLWIFMHILLLLYQYFFHCSINIYKIYLFFLFKETKFRKYLALDLNFRKMTFRFLL